MSEEEKKQEESNAKTPKKELTVSPEQVHIDKISVSEPRQKILPQVDQEVLKVVPMKPEWQDIFVEYTVLLKEITALQHRSQSLMNLMTGMIERGLEEYDHVIQIDEEGKNVLVLKQEKK